MADNYTWNNPASLEAKTIEAFLTLASRRIDTIPTRLPFVPRDGRAVLGWLRAMMDRKPSELGES